MLEEIYIRDLGVIQEARLGFKSGLTVLTGETGAGKTMVLTALGLLLGERGDSSAVRRGQEQAYVEGRWFVPGNEFVAEKLSEVGASGGDGELILNRSVSAEGRSRASLSGRAIPVNVLAELGDQLVVVHGQSDQLRLKSASAQREALDQFAGSEFLDLLAKYRQAFESHRELAAKLVAIKQSISERSAEAEGLKVLFEEFERVQPIAGEDQQLAELANRLTYVEELRASAIAAHEALSSEGFDSAPDAIGLVGIARKQLEHVSEHDPELARLAQLAKEIGYQLGELATDLSSYVSGLEGDGANDLELVQSRRAVLNALIRKHGETLEDVFVFARSASDRLLELDSSSERIEALEEEVAKAGRLMAELAAEVSRRREAAAKSLADEVTQELKALAMPGSSLVVAVTESAEFSSHGKDNVSIQLSSYPGAEPRPLGKGASGGELSRIMLAIEVVLAKTATVATFIFDEVDAGVGGAAAIEVGRRLAKLANQAQVIVVTHLAQVAAFANRHLNVLKTTGQEFTVSDVVALTESQRVTELARMLSGLGDSQSAQSHAAELLTLARAEIR